MKIKKLTLNTKISDFTILSKIILCNKSTHLEIYDLVLEYICTIQLSFYIERIIKYTEDILILVGKDKYEISVIELNRKTGEYILVRIGYQETPLSNFTRYHVWYNIVILYSLKSFKIYYYNRDKLVEDDLPNDFDFFSMCHLNFCGGVLNIVAKDIEDTTYLLRYNTKLALTKKSKKACTAIFSYGLGYIFLGDGTIWYEIDNKKVAESEFGNTRVISYIVLKTDLVISMENNELIRVNVREDNIINVQVFKMNTYENLHIVDDYILGHTICGVCSLFRFKNQKLDILQNINSIGKLDKFLYNENRLVFYNDKFQSILSNLQSCTKTPVKQLECDIESFYVFKDIFIEVYNNLTRFNSIIKNYDISAKLSPLNYKVMGFYSHNDTLYFYSNKAIHSLIKESINISTFSHEIILCSFYQDSFVVFDVNGMLQTKEISIYFPDVSCIIYHDNLIYISTYNDKFIIFDTNLVEVYRINQVTFILGTVYNDRIYFYDSNGCLYYFSTERNFFGGEKYNDITKLVVYDKLYLIGKYTILFDELKKQKVFLDITDIRDIVKYKDDLYILVKGIIYSVKFVPSSYKYIHDANSCSYMDKQGSKMFKVDNKGLLHYGKSKKKHDSLKNYTINNFIKAEYNNKVYTLLSDHKIYRFNTRTNSLTQETSNKKLIDVQDHVKITYNELVINKKIIKHNKGLIRNVCVKNDKVLVIDFFNGFYIYDLKNGWTNIDQSTNISNDVLKRRKTISKKKYYLGYIWNDKIMLSDGENIIISHIQTGEITKYKINEKVSCFSEHTLEIDKSILYCVTEGNSVWKLE